MSTLRSQISDVIAKRRPAISPSSLSTYTSTILNLYKRVPGQEKPESVQWYVDNIPTVLEHIKDEPANKLKGTLAAMYVFSGDTAVHEKMLESAREVNERYAQQRMTKREAEAWVDWPDVVARYHAIAEHNAHLWKRKTLSPEDMNVLRNQVLLASYVLMPAPRRSMDFGTMKLRNYRNDKDNHIDMKGKKAVFHLYKTAKVYGRQETELPPAYLKLIKQWMKVNQSDYLLLEPMSSSLITKTLHTMFGGRKVGVSMLRHSFLSWFYEGDTPAYNDMRRIAEQMGHSINTALRDYVKRD